MHRIHNGTRFLYYVAGGIKGHPKVVLEYVTVPNSSIMCVHGIKWHPKFVLRYVTVQYFSIMCVHNNL